MNEEFNSNLAGILECTEDAIISKSLDGTIQSWNKGSEKMFGYTSKEMIGKNISLIIPPEFIYDDTNHLSRISNNEIVDRYETTRIKKNGEQLFVSLIVADLKDSAGNITGVFQVARDITPQKKSEAELFEAYKELAFQNQEKDNRAAELLIANKELVFQNEEKHKRAEELLIANKELAFQNEEKEKRAAELLVGNNELAFQNEEKHKRAEELLVANEELVFQNEEKEKRAAELLIANKELVFQNEEKHKRAAELLVANEELAFQNEEKHKRAEELLIANKELAFQNEEKEKRANELIFINTKLKKTELDLSILNAELEQKVKDRMEKLSLSEAFNEGLLNSLSSHIAVLDKYGNIVAVNNSWINFAKENGDDSLLSTGVGSNYLAVCKKAANEDVKEGYAVANGIQEILDKKINHFYLEYPCHSPTEQRWFALRVMKFKSDKPMVVTTHQDITERKEAEEKAKQSAEEKNAILESISDGFFALDNNWIVTYWNLAAEQSFNVNKNDIIGKSLWEVFPDSENTISYRNHHLAMKTKQPMYFEDYYPVLNIWHDIASYPSENGITIIFKDITKQKEAEQKLSSSLKEIADYKFALDQSSIVALTDQKGIIKYVNDNFLNISKYSREELIGQDHRIISSGYHSSSFIKNLWVTIANGKIWNGELKNKAKDGSTYWVDTTIVPFLDNEGKPYQYMAIRADITERKKAESKLIENENYLRTILDSEPECVKVLNRKGELLSMNPAGLAMIEADNEQQVLGRRMTDLVNKKYQSGFNQLSKEIFKGNPGIFEFEITGLKGGCRWLETHAVPLKDTTGKIVNLLGVTRDITERKKADEKIIESENRMRLATSSAGMGIWYWDNKNDNMVWDKKLYQIYDITESQLGSVYEGWLSRLHPEDKDRVNEVMQTAIVDKKREYSSEFRIIWSDLSVHYIKGTGITEYDVNGNVIGMMGVNWDVTAEKEQEQHLKLLESVITNTNDSILITEAEPLNHPGPKILYVNEAFTKMTGYSSEEVLGKTPRILQGPKTDKDELQRLSEAIRKWESYETTLINYKKSGEEFWINFTLTPVANEKGWYTHWISIERDVTDLKKYISAIENQNIKLREIAWTQSHIVRAPLARMLGLVNLIKDTKLDSTEYYEWLNHFTDSANELDNVIKDISSKAQNILVKTD